MPDKLISYHYVRSGKLIVEVEGMAPVTLEAGSIAIVPRNDPHRLASRVGLRPADASEIAVVQIAGLIARRIVTFVSEGESVGAGQRIGLIRFGSRVDVYLPPGHGALVALGQRAIGGETVLADLKSPEPEREARWQ